MNFPVHIKGSVSVFVKSWGQEDRKIVVSYVVVVSYVASLYLLLTLCISVHKHV